MSYFFGSTVQESSRSIYHSRGDEEIPEEYFSGDERTTSTAKQSLPLLDDDDYDEASLTSTSSSSSSEPSDSQGGTYNGQNYARFDDLELEVENEYFEKTSYGRTEVTEATFGSPPPSPAKEVKEVILFGCDLSNLSSTLQFTICASGVFFFNIIYGYLQELIQIQIAGRKFAIFLGACQFAGYAFWSAILSALRTWRLKKKKNKRTIHMYRKSSFRDASDHDNIESNYRHDSTIPVRKGKDDMVEIGPKTKTTSPPFLGFLTLAIIRAVDLGLTNLSMRYLNYPAKTLIKSSRVIFTMVMGIVIGRKKYAGADYAMVVLLVFGLGLFLHADMNSNAIFHPLGVMMLVTSLSIDGTVSNWSEVIMNRHNMGQDAFQMKLYFFSFIIMTLASYQANELISGIQFFFQTPGTMTEVETESSDKSWSVQDKTLALFFFSTFGIFGGSCACAITKRFGALTMSVTTTTRKAATIFVSFAMFPNACTPEHIIGVLIFVFGLLLKGGLCSSGIDLMKALTYLRTRVFSPLPFGKRVSCLKARQ